MSVTASDLQNLIITTLSNADPTALAGLQANVGKYWTLFNRQGVLPELQYWYCRREAIRYLMACLTQQVDFMRRNTDSTRAMTASMRQDNTMTASASEDATSVANRSSSSSYSALTTSTGSGSSTSNRSASQTMRDNSSLSDVGAGSNSSKTTMAMASGSTINSSSCDSTATERTGVDAMDGYRVHNNGSEKAQGGGTIGIGGQVTFSSTYESMPESVTQPDTWAAIGEPVNVVTNIQYTRGNSGYLAKLNDTRTNTFLQTTDTPIAFNYSNFNANRTTSDVMRASGSSLSTSTSANNFSLSGSGSGSMTGTGAGGSSMTAASTRTATGSGEAHRLSVSQAVMTLTLEKLHQRFLHLQEMWKAANEMIEWFEKHRLSLPYYVLQAITIQYPNGCNADAANLFLVKTPFGTLSPQVPHVSY
jgi:hypothetical protein